MILDTNALSAFADGNLKLKGVLASASTLAIPVIVLGEYRYGISRSSKKRDYETWIASTLPTLRILEVTEPTTVVYASVRLRLREEGTPIPENDVWIAALAIEHAMPLVSRDRHFDHVQGLKIHSW